MIIIWIFLTVSSQDLWHTMGMEVWYMLMMVLTQWILITQCSITVLKMEKQYISLHQFLVSECYVQTDALLLSFISLILMLQWWIKCSIYQYEIALIQHLEIFQFTYPQDLKWSRTQTVQWTMLFGVLVLFLNHHPFSHAHTAHSQTTRYLVTFAYASIQPQEQYNS